MKKRFLCVALCAVFLLCGGTGCQLIPNPHVRTGTYNGQTITMEYTLKTNLEYPVGMGYISMINDYAVFWDMSDYGPKVQGDTWNALDRQGEVLFDEPYMELTYFNSNGQAAAQKQSGGYVLVTAEREETPITEAEYYEFEKEISAKYRESSIKFSETNEVQCVEHSSTIGYVYDGLAPYVQTNGEGTYLLGLVNDEGSIVIPACLPIDFLWYVDHLTMHEDTLIINDFGYIGFVTITRS